MNKDAPVKKKLPERVLLVMVRDVLPAEVLAQVFALCSTLEEYLPGRWDFLRFKPGRNDLMGRWEDFSVCLEEEAFHHGGQHRFYSFLLNGNLICLSPNQPAWVSQEDALALEYHSPRDAQRAFLNEQ